MIIFKAIAVISTLLKSVLCECFSIICDFKTLQWSWRGQTSVWGPLARGPSVILIVTSNVPADSPITV